jgi:hypothetical protein
VQVVQQLCEPFRGNFRTIYIDRFYRIPKQLSIAKSFKEFKALNRGDSICHTFLYKTLSGENIELVLLLGRIATWSIV